MFYNFQCVCVCVDVRSTNPLVSDDEEVAKKTDRVSNHGEDKEHGGHLNSGRQKEPEITVADDDLSPDPPAIAAEGVLSGNTYTYTCM